MTSASVTSSSSLKKASRPCRKSPVSLHSPIRGHVLVAGLKHVKPVFGKLQTTVLALLGFIGSLWFGYHVLMHLPTWDFRAYKVGANIQEGMTTPEDAAVAVVEYAWKFNVNGEEKVITTNGSYPSVDGEYIGVETKVVEPPKEKKKLSYKEKIEFESLEKDMETLSEENTTIAEKMNSGITDTEEIKKLSLRMSEIANLIETKENRWLELSEFV